jgi:hypothetical protein
MRLLISEILEKVHSAKTEEEKINILRVNYSPALEDVFKWAYDPNIVFFTKEIPPYTLDVSPDGLSFTTLYNEHKRFYLFLNSSKINSERKTILLIQMLEALGPKESKVLENVIMKNIPSVPMDMASKAYPGLFSKPIKIPMEA